MVQPQPHAGSTLQWEMNGEEAVGAGSNGSFGPSSEGSLRVPPEMAGNELLLQVMDDNYKLRGMNNNITGPVVTHQSSSCTVGTSILLCTFTTVFCNTFQSHSMQDTWLERENTTCFVCPTEALKRSTCSLRDRCSEMEGWQRKAKEEREFLSCRFREAKALVERLAQENQVLLGKLNHNASLPGSRSMTTLAETGSQAAETDVKSPPSDRNGLQDSLEVEDK